MTEKNNREKKPVFLYIVIVTLSLALAALGALTFLGLHRLTDLQRQVNSMQNIATEINNSATGLKKQAEELKRLEQEEKAAAEQVAQNSAPQEEGTLSPSTGSSFTGNTDDSMDNLLTQIKALLPQNNGDWSLYVCNLMKGSEGTIHDDKPMQAASLIKLFIMGAVYENYETLTSTYENAELDRLLNAMITVSDNDAANTLVTYLGSGDPFAGRNVVNQFCQSHGYTKTSMGRMLLEGTENGDNYTSVRDCGAFLREIYQLCNNIPNTSTLKNAEAMYHLLKLQERTHKIPAQLPDGVHVANKTGELADVENDAGIIFDTANGIDLVVCFMSENLTDTGAAQKDIAYLSRLIYGYYNET